MILATQDQATLSFAIYLLIATVISLAFGFWLWTLRDCVAHERPGSKEKIFWTIVIVVFFPLVGAFMYQVGRRTKRIRELGE